MTNSCTTLTVVPAKFLQESQECVQEGCGLTMHQSPAKTRINLQGSTIHSRAGQGPRSTLTMAIVVVPRREEKGELPGHSGRQWTSSSEPRIPG